MLPGLRRTTLKILSGVRRKPPPVPVRHTGHQIERVERSRGPRGTAVAFSGLNRARYSLGGIQTSRRVDLRLKVSPFRHLRQVIPAVGGRIRGVQRAQYTRFWHHRPEESQRPHNRRPKKGRLLESSGSGSSPNTVHLVIKTWYPPPQQEGGTRWHEQWQAYPRAPG